MRVLAVVAGGVLYAFALPPFDWWECAWFALVPLLWAVRGGSVASAFRYGVLCGYAMGWAVTWCFADAAARYFSLPFPVAVAALSTWYLVVCGVPFGCFAMASVMLFRSRRDGEVVFLVPVMWVATEWLRGYLMGQPWALLGYTQYGERSLIQVATITGVYGVSFLVALGNSALAMLLRRPGSAWTRWAIGGALAIILTCATAGSIALQPGPPEPGAAHEVAVVQTNVSPQLHWTRAYTDSQVAAHLRASEALPIGGPSLIVWPEHSVPRGYHSITHRDEDGRWQRVLALAQREPIGAPSFRQSALGSDSLHENSVGPALPCEDRSAGTIGNRAGIQLRSRSGRDGQPIDRPAWSDGAGGLDALRIDVGIPRRARVGPRRDRPSGALDQGRQLLLRWSTAQRHASCRPSGGNGSARGDVLSVDVLARVRPAIIRPGHDRAARPVRHRQGVQPLPGATQEHAVGRPPGDDHTIAGDSLGVDVARIGATLIDPHDDGASDPIGRDPGRKLLVRGRADREPIDRPSGSQASIRGNSDRENVGVEGTRCGPRHQDATLAVRACVTLLIPGGDAHRNAVVRPVRHAGCGDVLGEDIGIPGTVVAPHRDRATGSVRNDLG